MTNWNEDNFLERLMPQLRRESDVEMKPCPDSEMLSAFADDQVSPFLRDAIVAHLELCPRCQEIHERLRQFALSSVPAQDAEWVNAGKRLDNWMESFLQERAKKTRPSLKVAPPVRASRWKSVPAPFFPWAVGAVAVVVVGVLGVIFIRHGPAAPASVQIAQTNQVLPPEHPANSEPPPQLENPLRTNDLADRGTNTPEVESKLKPRATNRNNTRLNEVAPERPEESADLSIQKAAPESPLSDGNSARGPGGQTAQALSPPKPSTHTKRPMLPTTALGRSGFMSHAEASALVGNSSEEQVASESPPSAKNSEMNPSGETAHTYLPPKTGIDVEVPTDRGGKRMSAAPASLPDTYAASRRDQTSTTTPEQPLARFVVEDFSSLRLEAGTRLWIRMDRALPKDGTFTFQGNLMPPITSSATIALKPGTGINGAGTMKGGDVANILITDVVIGDVHYKLQGMSGAVNKNTAGSGWALPFYEDRILEMQLSADSVYEKAIAGGARSGSNAALQRSPPAVGNRGAAAGPTASPKQAAPAQQTPPKN